MITLRDLPIRPSFTEDKVRDGYTSELKDANTVVDLRVFLDRWNAIFRLNHIGRIDLKPCVKLANNDYTDSELEEAMICMEKCKNGSCSHIQDTDSDGCIGANIVLPPILIAASIASVNYGVSTDLAIIQMNGGIGELHDY